MSTSGNSNKKKRPRPKPPQPGDAGYKTPTQLRNARKRQQVRRDKTAIVTTTNAIGSPMKGSSIKTLSKEQQRRRRQQQDPSQRYIDNPTDAPIVQSAIRFFEEIFHSRQKLDDSLERRPTITSLTNDQLASPQPYRFPIVVGPTDGWRSVARLAVRSTHGLLCIGLFAPGTHALLPVPDCPVHHPRINSLVNVLQTKCRHHRIDAFDEVTGEGNLRHVAIAIERSTGKQQLVLVWRDSTDDNNNSNSNSAARIKEREKESKIKLDALTRTLVSMSEEQARKKAEHPNPHKLSEGPIHLQSLWIHTNNSWKHSNTILDRNGRWEQKWDGTATVPTTNSSIPDDKEEEQALALFDNPGLEERLTTIHPNLHIPLYFPPQVFRQANLEGFSKIIIKIREWLSSFIESSSLSLPIESRKKRAGKNESSTKSDENLPRRRRMGHCLELYGGVGTIGLHLIDMVSSLESSDENPFNKQCFEASVANLTLEEPLVACSKSKITYKSKSATDMVQSGALRGTHIVIVDPPRKGLDAPVLEALSNPKDDTQHPALQNQAAAEVLIYISCGFDAFQNDYAALVGPNGVWELDHAEGHLLFPGSDAIETLAFFKRRHQGGKLTR